MEHTNNHIEIQHPVLNLILLFVTTSLGFISTNFLKQLEEIHVILAPIVQLASILTFIFFCLINHEIIIINIKKIFKKK